MSTEELVTERGGEPACVKESSPKVRKKTRFANRSYERRRWVIRRSSPDVRTTCPCGRATRVTAGHRDGGARGEHAYSEDHKRNLAAQREAEAEEQRQAEARAVAETQEMADALLRAGFIQCVTCGKERRLDWFDGSDVCGICRDQAGRRRQCPGPATDGQCKEPVFANGRCSAHGQQMRRNGHMSVVRRRRKGRPGDDEDASQQTSSAT